MVGVLLALAGEAAWAERNDRVREQSILRDLLEEFQENEDRLLADISLNRQSTAAGELWADVMTGRVPASPDSARALFQSALNSARFDPVTGAIRSLVDGGELHLLQNFELRRVLAGWTDLAAEVRLTSASWETYLVSLLPVIVELGRPGTLTAGEELAVGIVVQSVAGTDQQLDDLLVRVQEIKAMIQTEIED